MLRFDIFQRYSLLRVALGAAVTEATGSSLAEVEVRAASEQTVVFREERDGENSGGVWVNQPLSMKTRESSGTERLQRMHTVEPNVQNMSLIAGASPYIAEPRPQDEHIPHASTVCQPSAVHQGHGNEPSVVKPVVYTGGNDDEVPGNYSNQLLQALQWLDRARESCAQTSDW